MTRKDAVLLASRALALYLLCWGLSDLSYLPQRFLSLGHHSLALIGHDYAATYYALEFAFGIVRIVALFAVASWLYRCSESVQALFLPSNETLNPAED